MDLPSNLLLTDQSDIERLVKERICEGPHIEFKRELPSNWDQASKGELAGDVTAFANAGGGDIIYGVMENKDAIAEAIVPQQRPSIDDEVLRVQSILQAQVEPRLPGVLVHPVAVKIGEVSGFVLVIRVPQSWVAPHRSKVNQHFYVREGRSKNPVAMPELRGLFSRSESQTQRVLNFRSERLGRLLTGEGAQRLVDGPILVAHIVPLQSVLGLVQVDPVPYTKKSLLPVLNSGFALARLNIDGAVAVRELYAKTATCYSQLFRNGFFEAVQALEIHAGVERVQLATTTFEDDLIKLLDHFRDELERLKIDTGCIVMVSLLRSHQMQLAVGYQPNNWYQTLFDRQNVVLPDVVIDSDKPAQIALKPVFDLLWQAAGFLGSENYDEQGNRVAKRR